MYGLVNEALVNFIQSKFGEEIWTAIQVAAGIKDSRFLSMQSYEDKITYDIVSAACPELNLPADEFLQAFGRYWLQYVRNNQLGVPLRLLGTDIRTAFQNLDAMCIRIGAGMPELNPPSFEVEESLEGSFLQIHFRSDRSGLAPFVFGLIEGIAEMMDQSVEIEIQENQDVDHDVFRVTILEDAMA